MAAGQIWLRDTPTAVGTAAGFERIGNTMARTRGARGHRHRLRPASVSPD
ncbi:hypothetical protein GTY81_23235 [Streptomyces sp. SID8366]|nr:MULTISPECIES: hypothetical protein [unclassified Streptomyces]MYU06747.1 hypothetical protein [Streptomyces sp. SID8366]MYU67253.1 hypothetical protein [Streptomyces sp. SID69]